VPRPVPKPDEILVQIHAAGLNPSDYAIPKGTFKPILRFQPPNLDFLQAASIPMVGLTSWQALKQRAQLKPGQTIIAAMEPNDGSSGADNS
jgi:NADPH:quinone reductase-like Zn-dependent oxidoreductase